MSAVTIVVIISGAFSIKIGSASTIPSAKAKRISRATGINLSKLSHTPCVRVIITSTAFGIRTGRFSAIPSPMFTTISAAALIS